MSPTSRLARPRNRRFWCLWSRWGVAWLVALALAGSPLLAVAQDAQAQLQAFVKEVDSATGSFEQTRDPGADRSPPVQTGTFAFERPGKFRWEVTQPYDQLIVSDGRYVYQYDPDLDQVIQRDANQAVGASPAALLFGSGSLDEAFELEPLPDRDDLQWLRAVPRAGDAGFAHADIAFSDGMPRQLVLLDAFGQTTRIVFGRFRADPQLPADTFRFQVPEGATLVKSD